MLPPPSDNAGLQKTPEHPFVARLNAALFEAQVEFSRIYSAGGASAEIINALEDVGNRYIDMADALAYLFSARKVEEHAIAGRDG